ncbi:MAG: 50S ribosome-binding GTPase, partial [Endomicrobium sp.]|nr:50S ribosome-binding GTPase [Endomicrobium sp.]
LKIKNISDALTNLIAFMEVNLDHPEEDVIFLPRSEKLSRIDSCIENVQNLLNSYKISRALHQGIKVAIVGKPNTGKSSLLNAVLDKNRAIVTDIAGTTTDTIEETIDCNGIPLTIIDTAGIRSHTENLIELLGQEKTRETATKADILICLLDNSLELDQNDVKIADFLTKSAKNIPVIGVLNKCDLPSTMFLNGNSVLNFTFAAVVKISAKTKTGITDLLNTIAKIAGAADCENDYLMINSRHFTLLQNAFEALMRTKKALCSENADEIACFEAAAAKTSLNEILGINVKQDILDTIFSTFCIGK